MLRQQGLEKTEVIGTTGPLYFSESDTPWSRSNKILADIEQRRPARALALDDMPLLPGGEWGFIQTDPAVGLTEEDVEAAINYLNGEDNA